VKSGDGCAIGISFLFENCCTGSSEWEYALSSQSFALYSMFGNLTWWRNKFVNRRLFYVKEADQHYADLRFCGSLKL
jgi:hypothetical protein